MVQRGDAPLCAPGRGVERFSLEVGPLDLVPVRRGPVGLGQTGAVYPRASSFYRSVANGPNACAGAEEKVFLQSSGILPSGFCRPVLGLEVRKLVVARDLGVTSKASSRSDSNNLLGERCPGGLASVVDDEDPFISVIFRQVVHDDHGGATNWLTA